MAATHVVDVSEPEILRRAVLVVRVQQPIWWQVRKRLGLWLMVVGVWITGMGVEFEPYSPESDERV